MPKRTEQTSYSVDEMMERLREGERAKRRSEESELVTRPDGSQVVRVRRRRRRSKQPHKTKRILRKRGGLILLASSGLVLVGLAVTLLILLARFNSKGYRDELKERILSATGAKVGINELSVTPLRVRAGSMKFNWPHGGLARSLKLQKVEADLEFTSFFGADWNGEEATAGSGVLILAPPDESSRRALADGNLPFDYPGYRCSNFEILYGEDPDAPAIRVNGTEMTLRTLDEGGMQLLMKGGHALVSGWEELKLKRATAQLKDGRFDLVSLRVAPVSDGGGEAILRSTKAARTGSPALF
nr:hypothetical protein [Akkermansiaceae bacterium]